MNKEINDYSRGNFLKQLSLALVSVFSFGIIGLSFSKKQLTVRNRFKFISTGEANGQIKKDLFIREDYIKPEPPPVIS